MKDIFVIFKALSEFIKIASSGFALLFSLIKLKKVLKTRKRLSQAASRKPRGRR